VNLAPAKLPFFLDLDPGAEVFGFLSIFEITYEKVSSSSFKSAGE
jgi:hypothetical protein